MKHYYIRAEINEEYPDYDFVVRARSLDGALTIANEILEKDYPEEYRKDNFYCKMITAKELLAILTIN